MGRETVREMTPNMNECLSLSRSNKTHTEHHEWPQKSRHCLITDAQRAQDALLFPGAVLDTAILLPPHDALSISAPHRLTPSSGHWGLEKTWAPGHFNKHNVPTFCCVFFFSLRKCKAFFLKVFFRTKKTISFIFFPIVSIFRQNAARFQF